MEEQITGQLWLKAGAIFAVLQRKAPCQFADRPTAYAPAAFERWRATAGLGRDVFFAKQHVPGRLLFRHSGRVPVVPTGTAETISSRPECVLGAQKVDRGASGGAYERRHGGGLVRGPTSGATATVARSW